MSVHPGRRNDGKRELRGGETRINLLRGWYRRAPKEQSAGVYSGMWRCLRADRQALMRKIRLLTLSR
jgi:hypothetical protein